MSNSLEKIKGDALSLTIQDRAKLTKALIYSLDTEMKNDLHNMSWDAELEKRVKEILDGEVKGVPAEQVFAKIRKKYH
jgi:putative addiction module component (TIGR02574 family)